MYHFTLESLRNLQVRNSNHYLLGFWAGLVNPVLHQKVVQAKAPPGLDGCFLQVAILYIQSTLPTRL